MRSLIFIALIGCLQAGAPPGFTTQGPPPPTDFSMNVVSSNSTCANPLFSEWTPLGQCQNGKAAYCDTVNPAAQFVVSLEYGDTACATAIVRYQRRQNFLCLPVPQSGSPFPQYWQQSCLSSGTFQVPALPPTVPAIGDWAKGSTYVGGCPATFPSATLIGDAYIQPGICVQGSALYCQPAQYTFVTYGNAGCLPTTETSVERVVYNGLCIQKMDGTFEARQCNGASAAASTPPSISFQATGIVIALFADPACTLPMGTKEIKPNVFQSTNDCSEYSCLNSGMAQYGQFSNSGGSCTKNFGVNGYRTISTVSCEFIGDSYMRLTTCNGVPTASYQSGQSTTFPPFTTPSGFTNPPFTTPPGGTTTTSSFPPFSTQATPSNDYVYFQYSTDSRCTSVFFSNWNAIGQCQGNTEYFCDPTATKVIGRSYGGSQTCNGTATSLFAYTAGACIPSMGSSGGPQSIRVSCSASGIIPAPTLPVTTPGVGDWAKGTFWSPACPGQGGSQIVESFITPAVCSNYQKLFCLGGTGYALATYNINSCLPGFETSLETVPSITNLCVSQPNGQFITYSCSATNPAANTPPTFNSPQVVSLNLYTDATCTTQYGTRMIAANNFIVDRCYEYSCLDPSTAQFGEFQRSGVGCSRNGPVNSYTTITTTSCSPVGDAYARLVQCTGVTTPPYSSGQSTTFPPFTTPSGFTNPPFTTTTPLAFTTPSGFTNPPFTTNNPIFTTQGTPSTDYVYWKSSTDSACTTSAGSFFWRVGQCQQTTQFFCNAAGTQVIGLQFSPSTQNCTTPTSVFRYTTGLCIPSTGSSGPSFTSFTCRSSGLIPPPAIPPTQPGGDWAKQSVYLNGCPPFATATLAAESFLVPAPFCGGGRKFFCTATGYALATYSDPTNTCSPGTETSLEIVPSIANLCVQQSGLFFTFACSTTQPALNVAPVVTISQALTLNLFTDASCTTQYGTKVVQTNIFVDQNSCREFSCIDSVTAQTGQWSPVNGVCSKQFPGGSYGTASVTCSLFDGQYVQVASCTGPPTPPYSSGQSTTFPPFTTPSGFTNPPFTTPSGFTNPPFSTNPPFTTSTPFGFTTPSGFTNPPFTTPSGFTNPPFSTNPPFTTSTPFGFTTPSGFTNPPFTTPSGFTNPPFSTNPPFTTSTPFGFTTPSGFTNPPFTTPSGFTNPPFSTNPPFTTSTPFGFTTPSGFTNPPFSTPTGFTNPPFSTPTGFTNPPFSTPTGFTNPPFTTPSGFTGPPVSTQPGTTGTPISFTTPSGFTNPPVSTGPGTTNQPFTTPSGFTNPPVSTNPPLTTTSGVLPVTSQSGATSTSVPATTPNSCLGQGSVCATVTTTSGVSVSVQITLNFPQGVNYCSTLGVGSCQSGLYNFFNNLLTSGGSTTSCYNLGCSQARRRRIMGGRNLMSGQPATSAVSIDVAVRGADNAVVGTALNRVVTNLDLNQMMQSIQSTTSVQIPQATAPNVQLVATAAVSSSLNLTQYDSTLQTIRTTPIATFAPLPVTTPVELPPFSTPRPARCGCPRTLASGETCGMFYCRVKTTPNRWGWSRFYDAICQTSASGAAAACSCPTSITPPSQSAAVTVSETQCLCCQITNRRQCTRTAVNTPRPDCCYWRGGKCRDPPRLWRANGSPALGSCPTTRQDAVVSTTTTQAPVAYSILMSAAITCTVQSNATQTALCDYNFAYGFGPNGGWDGLVSVDYDAALGDDNTQACTATGNSITINGFLWFPRLSESELQALKTGIDRLKTAYTSLQTIMAAEGLTLTCTVDRYFCYDWSSTTNARGTLNGGACTVIGIVNGGPRVVQSVSVFVVVAIASLFFVAL